MGGIKKKREAEWGLVKQVTNHMEINWDREWKKVKDNVRE